jgi:NACalpha-BTF3-like transcription factor
MDISFSPASALVPTILGDQSSSPSKDFLRLAEQQQAAAQLITKTVTEAEKQSARNQLEDRNSGQQNGSNLYREQLPAYESKAISAYEENQGDTQKAYLSDVLGIDVRV